MQQHIETFKVPKEILPEQQDTEHMALNDARHNVAFLYKAYEYIKETYPDIYSTLFGSNYIPDMSAYSMMDEDIEETSISNSAKNSLDKESVIPSFLE